LPSTSEAISTETRLEILHDHYKETFARVVQVERTRDRQFLWVILLFALLCVEVGYPVEFKESVGEVKAFDVKVAVSALPLPALLNATWVLTLAVVLSYCRTSIWVTRQYRYVHDLEDIISPIIDAGNAYRREGLYYEDNYPTLLNVSWIAYVYVFPAILLFAVFGLVYWENTRLPYPEINRLFDYCIAVAILLTVFLYQFQPRIAQWWRDRKTRSSRNQLDDDEML
jgi:hypothetical protein